MSQSQSVNKKPPKSPSKSRKGKKSNRPKKVLELLLQHFQEIDFVLLEKMKDSSNNFDNQDYIAMSLFRSCFASIELLAQSQYSEDQRSSSIKKLPEVGRDLIQFQMQLGLRFTQHPNLRISPSDDDDDDDLEPTDSLVGKTRNQGYVPQPTTPPSDLLSRNRVESENDKEREISSTPLPFTTYTPSKNPPLEPPNSYIEVKEFMKAAGDGDSTRLSNLIEEAMVKGQLKSLSSIGEIRDDNQMNVLDHASASGQVEVIRELILTYGVDVNGADETNGLTPLHHACRAGQMQAVTFLVLVASADVTRISQSGLTPCDITTSKLVRKFFEKHVSTPGSVSGGSEKIKSVPSNGHDPTSPHDGSDLSVSSSSTSQHVSPTPEWKNRVQGALKRSSATRGTSATTLSTSSLSSISLYPENGRLVSSKSSNFPTSTQAPSIYSLKSNSHSSEEKFHESTLLNPASSSTLPNGLTSVSIFDPSRIFQSVCDGDTSRLSNLIEEAMVKGQLKSLSAIGEFRDDNQMNVLDHASASGQVEVIRELILTYGVDVNGADETNGLTPLHHACRAGQMQAVTFLVLVASADVTRVSQSGLTPYDITTSKRIQKFLLGQKSVNAKSSSHTPQKASNSSVRVTAEFHRLESAGSNN